MEAKSQHNFYNKTAIVQAMETVHIKTGESTGVNWKNV